MASGVYPYITDAGQTVSEWTEDNVQPLLDKYNAYLTSIGKSYQITLQGGAPTIRGFLQQGAIVIANDVWDRLRELVQWIQSEYALSDNQAGVQLGNVVGAGVDVPIEPDYVLIGKYVGSTASNTVYYAAAKASNAPSVCKCAVVDGFVAVAAVGYVPQTLVYFYDVRSDGLHSGGSSYLVRQTYNGVVFSIASGIAIPNLVDYNLPVYANQDEFFQALLSGDGFSGVTADTTLVAPLDALPADTPWGGLVVEGAGDVASPSVVEGVIAEAIEQREKPAVQPVTITIPPNTEIDPETGQTDPPIVITPFPVPAPTGLELGEELLDALETHFPFSIPWDLYNIFVRLDAQPVAPRFTLTTPALSSGLAPLTLTIDVATTPFDSFAPVFRAFVGILLAIGMLIGASRWIKR